MPFKMSLLLGMRRTLSAELHNARAKSAAEARERKTRISAGEKGLLLHNGDKGPAFYLFILISYALLITVPAS